MSRPRPAGNNLSRPMLGAVMNVGIWNQPVIVRLGSREEEVASTLEAIQVLVHQWPVQGGALHARACDICFAVLDGEADPEKARHAFAEAATEAGILVE